MQSRARGTLLNPPQGAVLAEDEVDGAADRLRVVAVTQHEDYARAGIVQSSGSLMPIACCHLKKIME